MISSSNCALKVIRKNLLITGLSLCTILMSSSTIAQTTANRLSLELSQQAQEAINNGVSLTIDCTIANIESRFLFNLEHDKKIYRFTLGRHTLSNSFIVKRDDIGTPHTFRSIADATNYITGEALNLLEYQAATDPARHMRLSINKFELPAPMRLQAFIFDEWDLDTGWLQWQFES